MSSRSWSWVLSLPLALATANGASACRSASTEPSDAGATEDEPADAEPVTDASEVTKPCIAASVWGTRPAAAGTLYALGEGHRDIIAGTARNPAADLAVELEAAQAQTLDGRTVDCQVVGRVGACKDEAGLRSLSITVGGETYARDVRYEGGVCGALLEGHSYGEDIGRIRVDAAPCVEPQTVVLEGALVHFSAQAPVQVWLMGEAEPVLDPDSDLHYSPYRGCEVLEGRYRCSSLGYDRSVRHTLIVRQNGLLQLRAVDLQVSDCAVTPKQLDVDAERIPL